MGQMGEDIADWKYFLSIISKCTDDYLYIYDLSNDYAVYSSSITKDFELDVAEFSNAGRKLKDVIYPDDYEAVFNNISELQNGHISCHNMEYRWKSRKNGYVFISCRGQLVRRNGINYMIGRVLEIGKKNRYDNVTGIYTDLILEDRYDDIVKSDGHTGCIMQIGIDNFKEINEKYGTKTGDEVLAILAGILVRQSKEQTFSVYRTRGDEFIIVSLDMSGDIKKNAKMLYKTIREDIDSVIDDRGYDVFFNISAGAYAFDTNTDTYKDIIKNTRFALHKAKLNGKNRFEFFDKADYANYIKRLEIQGELRSSVNDNFKGFELFYQPIVDADTGRIEGAEALLRWKSDQYGFMSPVEFIPLLEESSLIIPLGRWIIDTAAAQCNEWVKIIPQFVMHINLSFVQIAKSNVIKDVIENINKYDAGNEHFVFEITESIQMDSNIAIKRVLKEFVDNGFLLAIDDFGTGYSNFEYMKDKMFGILKIDRAFITDIHLTDNNRILVSFIIKMAHEMGVKICVEGVETKDELMAVTKLEADYIQGYYYGKPVKDVEFCRMIKQQERIKR